MNRKQKLARFLVFPIAIFAFGIGWAFNVLGDRQQERVKVKNQNRKMLYLFVTNREKEGS